MSSFNPIIQDKKIDSKIVVSLERISEAFRVLLWDESKKNSLSPIQIQILIFLLFHSKEQCKVSYLAKEFNMTKATISDSIKALHRKELIKKESDVNDTRSYTISLSTKGMVIARQSSIFTKPFEKTLENMDSNKKEVILDGLLNLISSLNKAEVITIQRMCTTCNNYSFGNNTHYCKLLELELKTNELRIDCPEHAS
ncbi:DNA-binding transcriptional regulator, MarR family [Tenacibaculum sp. MAR_2009_124]|uniref:MarR family winged helix-turn-helix transcriptional regulator n=1 Tax=Tenacibaculum sp. MAR_2009_124 TaxID=1250059 RepID=UPI000899E5C7|nr:MarR family winged helix-turn-helix transcriptional regulator [Tenacibaculum sp. MAR_2009_124]SEC27529.1 DNA-binding transcriptional regulator, MarR family [Tenacibaculum sp. MAR_2009_124]